MCSSRKSGEGELRGQPANPGSHAEKAVKTECVCHHHHHIRLLVLLINVMQCVCVCFFLGTARWVTGYTFGL